MPRVNMSSTGHKHLDMKETSIMGHQLPSYQLSPKTQWVDPSFRCSNFHQENTRWVPAHSTLERVDEFCGGGGGGGGDEHTLTPTHR